ncbi:MAG: hypothetical protein PHQ05_04965 [Sterolibacterium sp.]|nr:hypothetical protein [Sterolibacterium sp.]
MATGIVGTVAGAGTLTYSPTVNSKVLVSANGTAAASVTINGTVGLLTNSVLSNLVAYVGAGQTLTVVSVTAANVFISCIEEDLP